VQSPINLILGDEQLLFLESVYCLVVKQFDRPFAFFDFIPVNFILIFMRFKHFLLDLAEVGMVSFGNEFSHGLILHLFNHTRRRLGALSQRRDWFALFIQ